MKKMFVAGLLGLCILVSPAHADSWRHNFNNDINITKRSHYWQERLNKTRERKKARAVSRSLKKSVATGGFYGSPDRSKSIAKSTKPRRTIRERPKRRSGRQVVRERSPDSLDTSLRKFSKALACVPDSIVQALEDVAKIFGPIKVNSTHRPGARVAGTNRTSYHSYCRAVDFNPPRGKYHQVARYLKKKGIGGVGTYSCSPHIHIDNGPRRHFHVNKC